jgi:hypothetical protein
MKYGGKGIRERYTVKIQISSGFFRSRQMEENKAKR